MRQRFFCQLRAWDSSTILQTPVCHHCVTPKGTFPAVSSDPNCPMTTSSKYYPSTQPTGSARRAAPLYPTLEGRNHEVVLLGRAGYVPRGGGSPDFVSGQALLAAHACGTDVHEFSR